MKKKKIILLPAFILCCLCWLSGCNANTQDAPPAKVVPVVGNMGSVISRLAENPVRVEIGQSDVTIELNYLAWPTITQDENGTLYAAASLRRGHIDPFGATAFFESTDGGETWSEPRIIYDSPLDDRDVGLVYIGEGKMVASFFTIGARSYRDGGRYAKHWGNCDETQKQAKLTQWDSFAPGLLQDYSGNFIMTSEDYGKTWNAPTRVSFTCPHGPSLMNDGKTLICATVAEGIFSTYMSEDSGNTWYLNSAKALPLLTDKGGFYEPHIIQLSDGSFLAGIRSENANGSKLGVWITRSEDGKNWTIAEEISSVEGAPPHLLELSSGIVVMTYSYRQNHYGVRACYSIDGGKTWSDEQIILSENTSQRNNDLGYPASVELDDGTILTAYYQPYGNDAPAALLYTKWQLASLDG